MTTGLWITSIIGVLGFGLGITNFIRDVRRYSPRVKLRESIITSSNPFDSPKCMIQVTNISMVNITIERIALGLKNNQQLFSKSLSYSSEMPILLKQGASVSCQYDGPSVAESLYQEFASFSIKTRPYCVDSTGTTYTGKWSKFPIKAMYEDIERRNKEIGELLKEQAEKEKTGFNSLGS